MILVGIYFINNYRVDDFFNGRLDFQGVVISYSFGGGFKDVLFSPRNF